MFTLRQGHAKCILLNNYLELLIIKGLSLEIVEKNEQNILNKGSFRFFSLFKFDYISLMVLFFVAFCFCCCCCLYLFSLMVSAAGLWRLFPICFVCSLYFYVLFCFVCFFAFAFVLGKKVLIKNL